eukprot:SAG11_NODE_27537_length_331_cov_1.275862_1_plen_110_part_11
MMATVVQWLLLAVSHGVTPPPPHLTDFGYYYGLSPRDGLAGFANHSTTTFVLNGAGRCAEQYGYGDAPPPPHSLQFKLLTRSSRPETLHCAVVPTSPAPTPALGSPRNIS